MTRRLQKGVEEELSDGGSEGEGEPSTVDRDSARHVILSSAAGVERSPT